MGILPEWCFQSWAISQSQELQEHYRQWQQQQSLVFSYCSLCASFLAVGPRIRLKNMLFLKLKGLGKLFVARFQRFEGRYPFLLNAGAKRRLLSYDGELKASMASQELMAKILRGTAEHQHQYYVYV